MATILLIVIFFIFSTFPIIILGWRQGEFEWTHCLPTRCREDGPLIKYPFRLMNSSQMEECGMSPDFDLHCNENQETVLHLLFSFNVSLRNINYSSQTIEFDDPVEDCLVPKLSSFNLSSSPFHFPNSVPLQDYILFNCSSTCDHQDKEEYDDNAVIISCLGVNGYQVVAIPSDSPVDVLSPGSSCTRILQLQSVPLEALQRDQFITLRWSNRPIRDHALKLQYLPGAMAWVFFSVATIAGVFNIISKHIQTDKKVEKFLKDYKALKPTRFSYADIRRMTKYFTEKLGEGGYGTVYKGKLSNKIYVAVKVLNNAKGNGQDFVNELSTIGSIHHVNIVRLVGFCSDGSKRALVYDFLPNDSLEKFIFQNGLKKKSLSWKKVQDISIGIAKGIEYLHQGCDKQILHCDIKPHNILLDHNLIPKICDFGLAKFCSKDKSAVSMTHARGTMGYIAPEMMSRTFGRVSYKSDVYSFGMMLLEIVRGRKSRDVTRNKSQVYFPKWIYNQLTKGVHEMSVKIDDEGSDDVIVKTLVVVGLWCIQWYPADRPSMKTVVQMLEGDGENLSLPPNPFPVTNYVEVKVRSCKKELEVVPE